MDDTRKNQSEKLKREISTLAQELLSGNRIFFNQVAIFLSNWFCLVSIWIAHPPK